MTTTRSTRVAASGKSPPAPEALGEYDGAPQFKTPSVNEKTRRVNAPKGAFFPTDPVPRAARFRRLLCLETTFCQIPVPDPVVEVHVADGVPKFVRRHQKRQRVAARRGDGASRAVAFRDDEPASDVQRRVFNRRRLRDRRRPFELLPRVVVVPGSSREVRGALLRVFEQNGRHQQRRAEHSDVVLRGDDVVVRELIPHRS
jgi:hypothetical protein